MNKGNGTISFAVVLAEEIVCCFILSVDFGIKHFQNRIVFPMDFGYDLFENHLGRWRIKMMNIKNKRLILLAMCISVFSMGECLAAQADMPVKLDVALPGAPQGGPAPINTQGVTQKWLDIPYASQSEAQKLDIYLPNSGEGPFPVIVAIHGGGFMVGDKNSGEVNAELTALNHGYAVVCINYRLSGEAAFPSAVYDAKAAVRFLKAHAAEYHLDAGRIAAWGDSAGGNLASMLGTTAGRPELEDLSMGNAEQSSAVQAVVDWFGPTNFNLMDAEFKTSGKKSYQQHDAADSAESRYMGAQITTIPEKVKLADPETYISKTTVPFFIENGSEDGIVPTQQSVDFAAKLEQVLGKDKVTYIQLQGANHGGPQFETQENLDKVFAFLDQHLKK